MAIRKSERLYHWVEDLVKRTLTKVWSDRTEQVLHLDKLPDNAKDYLLWYGARQKGADIHSDKELTVRQRQKITAEWISNLEKGIIKVRSTGLSAEIYAQALIATGRTLMDDLDMATAKVQGLMDAASELDDDEEPTKAAKEAAKALRKIKAHPKVDKWLIDNGHKQVKKASEDILL